MARPSGPSSTCGRKAAGRQHLAAGQRQPREHLEEGRKARVRSAHHRLEVKPDPPLRQRLGDREADARLRLDALGRRGLARGERLEVGEGVEAGEAVPWRESIRSGFACRLPNAVFLNCSSIA